MQHAKISAFSVVYSTTYNVPTTRGHHPIIFHTTFFLLTFRDYCGIKLLLGHQYGSHYLHLNLKKLVLFHLHNTWTLTLLTMQILISIHRPPYAPVKPCSISLWIRSILNSAGIDTRIFKGHSTRSASTSNARGSSGEGHQNGWLVGNIYFYSVLLSPDLR
jgi:hypothetical protein